MKKDPTQFRKRFKRWKSGELVYSSGRVLPEVVVTPYSSFHSELPDNLRNAPESEYTMHRYWELNGKPKTFKEGVDKGMFNLQKDGWHANSVAQDEFGNYEFMKPISHPTESKELDYYFSNEGKSFRNEYKLILDPSRPGFHKYERRQILPTNNIFMKKKVKPIKIAEEAYTKRYEQRQKQKDDAALEREKIKARTALKNKTSGEK